MLCILGSVVFIICRHSYLNKRREKGSRISQNKTRSLDEHQFELALPLFHYSTFSNLAESEFAAELAHAHPYVPKCCAICLENFTLWYVASSCANTSCILSVSLGGWKLKSSVLYAKLTPAFSLWSKQSWRQIWNLFKWETTLALLPHNLVDLN